MVATQASGRGSHDTVRRSRCIAERNVQVLDEAGDRVWRGRCTTEPGAIAAAVRRYAPTAVRIGLETGPLTTWLWTALTAAGLPMICLDARHAKRALDM